MGHPKTLIEFMELYPAEDECRQAIFEQRWSQGFCCRRCGHEHAWYLAGRGLYECAGCHFQSSLTAGTILSPRAPICASGSWRSGCWPPPRRLLPRPSFPASSA
jgi:transposase-like protein